MKAVVGLGNPGPKYEGTRHNIGFWVLESLAKRLGISMRESKAKADVGRGSYSGVEIVLAKPRTYMNNSGSAARSLVDLYGLNPSEFLVIYDDLDLSPGVVRLRAKGSSGGHKGMASIINYLGTQDFPRLRLGIGQVPDGWDGAEYVLSRPSRDERSHLAAAVQAGAGAALLWATEGLSKAMSQYNRVWPPAEGSGP